MPNAQEIYRETLRQKLDSISSAYRFPFTSQPQALSAAANPMQGAPGPAPLDAAANAAPAPMSAAPMPGAQPQASLDQAAAPPAQQGSSIPDTSQAPPLDFDESKLKGAKTSGMMINAAEPKSLQRYMAWYEAAVADIDMTYNNIMAKLGTRPDPDRPLSKKEKFATLMNFGLNLIKAAQPQEGNPQPGFGNSVARATGATIEGLDQGRQLEAQRHDSLMLAAAKGKQEALKGLGTYGDALKGQAALDEVEAKKGEMVGTESTTQGIYGRTRSGTVKPLTDEKGERLFRDRSSSERGDTDYEKKHRDLTRMFMRKENLSEEDARDRATQALTEKSGTFKAKSIRGRVRQEIVAVMRNTPEWDRARTGEARETLVDQEVERERKDRIRDAYNINLSVKPNVPVVRAPRKHILLLKENPARAPEFYQAYGYLPDDFWPEE